MNETILRWKGRLGSLKALAFVVLLFAGIFLALSIANLGVANKNTAGPQTLSISQFVNGRVETDKYVTVSGTAFYPAAYRETSDGRTTAEYFYLIDENTGHMVLVKAAQTLPSTDTTESATISGLTHATDSELQGLMESDFSKMREAGLKTSSQLYIGDGERPPSASASLLAIIGLGLVALLCVATFFFPTTVFAPHPIDSAATTVTGEAGVKASGRFNRLKSFNPSIVFGRGQRSFNNSVANLVPLDNHQLAIYIHLVVTYRTYGVKTGQRESEWAVILDPANMRDVEPGKVYGWKDRWAMRFRYNDDRARTQTLIITFNHAAAQIGAINALRSLGFSVGTGDAPAM